MYNAITSVPKSNQTKSFKSLLRRPQTEDVWTRLKSDREMKRQLEMTRQLQFWEHFEKLRERYEKKNNLKIIFMIFIATLHLHI